MALDEPGKDDEVFDEKGTKFVIEKDIFNQAKPINVDFVDTPQGAGFKLTSSLSTAEAEDVVHPAVVKTSRGRNFPPPFFSIMMEKKKNKN